MRGQIDGLLHRTAQRAKLSAGMADELQGQTPGHKRGKGDTFRLGCQSMKQDNVVIVIKHLCNLHVGFTFCTEKTTRPGKC